MLRPGSSRLLGGALLVLALVVVSGTASAQIPVQIIHNSADPAVATVDVYIDGTLTLDDFNFKQASPFVDGGGNPVILVNFNSTVSVNDASSTGSGDQVLHSEALSLSGTPTLIEIIGLLNPGNFAPNPDGRSTALDLLIFEGYKPAADNPLTAELMAVHAVTDAGGIDLLVRAQNTAPGVGPIIFSNLQYGDAQPYIVLTPSGGVILDVVDTGTSNVLETWIANFGLVGGAGVVGNAAGFLSPPTAPKPPTGDLPSAPSSHAGLTLFGAVASGFVFELAHPIPVQIIHNSADPAAEVLDVYADGLKIADNLGFKQGTPFIDGLGMTVTLISPTALISVADSGSVDAGSAIFSKAAAFSGALPGLIEIIGLIDPGSFDPNPDARPTALDFVTFDGYRAASIGGALKLDLMAVHGVTNLGGVDLLIRTGAPGVGIPLFTALRYGDAQPYLTLDPGDVILDVVDTGTNNLIETWDASFGLVAGGGVVGNAAGFLPGPPEAIVPGRAPTSHAGLILFGVVASGFVFELSHPTAVPGGLTPDALTMGANFPNPFAAGTVIPFALSAEQPVSLQVFDMQGRLVKTLVDETLPAGDYEVPFEVDGLASGVYFYILKSPAGIHVQKMTALK